MSNFWAYCLWGFANAVLRLRYKIHVKGSLEKLQEELKGGGCLFLPNHPSETDAIILTTVLWKRFKVHPVVVDYFFEIPVIRWILRQVGSIPIPNFDHAGSSLSRRRAEKTLAKAVDVLKRGDNLLIYPGGRLQVTAYQEIGGRSATERLLTAFPEAKVVLVRTQGLWGSSFSRAITGKVPNIVAQMLSGIKTLLLNGLFFTPRRKVEIEIALAPSDFPAKGSRIAINKYLEKWYNAPWGEEGEPLSLVSYRFWKRHVPLPVKKETRENLVDYGKIPPKVEEAVKQELARLTKRAPEEILPKQQLSKDLGLDSLDLSELAIFLTNHFGISSINPEALLTVGEAMAAAAGQEVGGDADVPLPTKAWEEKRGRPFESLAPGETLIEVFLNAAAMMGKSVACGDDTLGTMSYAKMKYSVVLLARQMAKLPGARIGILVPSTVAAPLFILAVLLAGKIPVMLNWTVGSRNFSEVVASSGIQKILSSWKFIDRVSTVDLLPYEEMFFCIEDMLRNLPITHYLRAFWTSRKGTFALLKKFGSAKWTSEDTAVLLYTSGTEGAPKGVPLSHKNLLYNERFALRAGRIKDDDILLAFLPPFHSFGFTITTMLPLLACLRVVYSPDPIDGARLVRCIEHWKVTVVCGSPTFIRNLVRVAKPEQLKTVRLFVSGAEKAPDSLYKDIASLGKEMLEGYGTTECSPIITLNRPGMPHRGVGVPLPGLELKIVDPETHQEVPVGNSGLVLVKGPSVFKGYLSHLASSPFLTINNQSWYNTGDLGFLDKESFLTLQGRLKRFVKIGGEMINLGTMEQVLFEHLSETKALAAEGDNNSLAILAKESDEERPLLYLLSKCDISVDAANQILREKGISNLARLEAVFSVKEIPVLGTGKMDLRQLQQQLDSLLEEHSKKII